MSWLLGTFTWLIIRCGFTFFMLNKKTAGASKLLAYVRKEGKKEDESSRRKADLFQKW